jgi:hypothetical protein
LVLLKFILKKTLHGWSFLYETLNPGSSSFSPVLMLYVRMIGSFGKRLHPVKGPEIEGTPWCTVFWPS